MFWEHQLLLLLSRFSRVRLCATPEMAAHQAPPSLGFSRQEHWSGLPFPSPMQESEKWKWSRLVMSHSSRPHGVQPTGLLRPWDFPGKSTGVGCHCLLLGTPKGSTNTASYLLGMKEKSKAVWKEGLRHLGKHQRLLRMGPEEGDAAGTRHSSGCLCAHAPGFGLGVPRDNRVPPCTKEQGSSQPMDLKTLVKKLNVCTILDAWGSALGRPRGMVWGGRREEGSGWGTHVYLWRIHFDIWQN